MGIFQRFIRIALIGCIGLMGSMGESGAVVVVYTPVISGPYAYITNYSSNNVSVIDTATDAVIATVAVGYGPYGVAVSPDATRAYVANYAGNSVSVIDTVTNTVIATVPIATRPYGLAVSPDGSRVYVVAYYSNNVSVIDTATHTVTAVIPVGQRPHGIVVSRDGKRVYVANYATNDVSVIDATLNSVSTTIPLPANSNPFGLAQTLDSSKLYVTGWSSNALYVVDTASGTVTASIPVGIRPVSVAVTPDASRVYVSNYSGSAATTVSVIDAATNTVVTDIPLPTGVAPSGVSVHPDGGRVYVASYSTGVVYVIDPTTNSITKSVTVGTRPYAFGSFISIPQPTLIPTLEPAIIGGYINNPTPTIIFKYGTQCVRGACQVSNNYFSTFTLNALLNTLQIGKLTTFSPIPLHPGQPGATANYTPPVRLPDGSYTITGQVQDMFGLLTSPVTLSFIVDTVAPRFLTLSPPDGGTYLNPTVTVSGTSDDPTASLYFVGGYLIKNLPGGSFSVPVTLLSGLNLFDLTLADPAGNTTHATLNLTYTPFTLNVISPLNYATLYSNPVTVTGNFSGATSATVNINGVAASVSGTNFSASVPLVYGSNTLIVTGTRSDDGKVLTQQLTVTSYAPNITITAPPSGATVSTNSVLVTGTVVGPVAAVTVNGVAATLSGSSFSASVPLVYGSNTLSVTATTLLGISATQTVHVTSLAPTIAINSPVAAAVINAATVTVSGTLQGPAGSTVSVNGVAATVTGSTYTAANVPLAYGGNTLTAVATAPGGTTASTAVTVTSTMPTLAITAPINGAIVSTDSVLVTGTMARPVTAITINSVAAALSGNNFSATVPLTYGSNTLTAVATAPDGTTASAAVTVTGATPTLAVTSPADGASISGDSILVTGTLLAPINTGLTVNGVVANVDNGKFYANNVPLQPGANTLTVTYTTADGTTATQTITVNSTGTSPIQVSAEPSQGVAPLAVSLAVQSQTGNPILSVSVDPGGSGSVGAITTSGSSATIQLTYPSPGTYLAKVTVTDSLGAHSQTAAITVLDPVQMDTLFNNLWTNMNNALIAGDKAKALTYLNTTAQTKYGPVFDVLLPFMPEIVASYSPLTRASLSSSIGEYAVRRLDGGVYRIFLIYFLQDTRGIWQIDEM